jgi:hypothetical protein
MKRDFIKMLAKATKENKNPTDLKPSIICVVESVSPLIVSSDDGKIQYQEGDDLFISEWFKLRCNIDAAGALSSTVPSECASAEGVTETHSQGGASCAMPSAIKHLSTAIQAIKTELLNLKCDLKKGDLVIIASLEQKDKYLLVDKVLSDD